MPELPKEAAAVIIKSEITAPVTMRLPLFIQPRINSLGHLPQSQNNAR
jgi:hypothetical protein